MRQLRKSVLIAALVLCVAGMAHARVRVLIKYAEYTGPTVETADDVLVDLERFGAVVGWSVKKEGSAWCLARSADECKVPDGGQGLFVKGQAFSGTTEMRGEKLFVSLKGWTEALGGSLKMNARVGVAQVEVEGMPSASIVNTGELLRSELKQARYTILDFYATW